MSLKEQLQGTGVALVTPYTDKNTIDFDALQRVIDLVITNGVQYVVTLGTTGETPVLSNEEKKDIVQFTLEAVKDRVPVVIGIGGNYTAAVIKEIESYSLNKIVAILSASPYYNKPSQEGLFQHYKAIAAATDKPIILYNVPGRTSNNIAAATTIRLANEVENIKGIKEASGNMVQCMHILRQRPEHFLVTSGDDHLALPLIACGMDGVISVAANCFPKPFSAMIHAALAGDYATARNYHYQLLQGFDLLFAENNPAGVKAFLSELQLIDNRLRLPLVPLSESVLQQVRQYLPTLK